MIVECVILSVLYLEEKICELFPVRIWEKFRVCLAISGGSDSVALLRAMSAIAERHRLRDNLCVVTINHKLRGEESDEEARFVQKLARNLGISAVVKNVDHVAMAEEAQRVKSLESAARNARYRLLLEEAERRGARYLLTAHHVDDQLETILFRLMRGVGLDGAYGISVFRPLNDATVLARPMLKVTRDEVLEYLAILRQDYRTDSSNASNKFVRNRIRNELVPTLNSIFPKQWQKSLLRHVEICKNAQEALDQESFKLEQEILQEERRNALFLQTLNALDAVHNQEATNVSLPHKSIAFPLAILQQRSEEVLRVFFRRVWRNQAWSVIDMGDDEWRRLAASTKRGTTTNQFPGNIVLTYHKGCVAILTQMD